MNSTNNLSRGSLKIVLSVESSVVLAALNSNPLSMKAFEEIREYRQLGGLQKLARASRRNWTRRQLQRTRIVTTVLRQYVDEWLNTGIFKDDVERLKLRSVVDAPHAAEALEEYTAKNRPRLIFSR